MTANLIVQIALGVLLGFIFLALFVFAVGLIGALFFSSVVVRSLEIEASAPVATGGASTR